MVKRLGDRVCKRQSLTGLDIANCGRAGTVSYINQAVFCSIAPLCCLLSFCLKVPNIPKSIGKLREGLYIYALARTLRRSRPLEANMVAVASRMLMREPKGRRNVVMIILGLGDLSRKSGKN